MTYKTLFIDSTKVKTGSKWTGNIASQVNGDQLARDISAALLEMTRQGYELVNSFPINSSNLYMGTTPYTYTEGVVLIFKSITSEMV